MAALATIPDPEMPISIVDLGLVEQVRLEPSHGGPRAPDSPDTLNATITLLPTFVGCPALDMIREDVRRTVGALPGIAQVAVRFIHEPRWTVDRITEAGRASLRAHGVTVPERGGVPSPPDSCGGGHAARATTDPSLRLVPMSITAGPLPFAPSAPVPCPFCGSVSTHLDSPFGPTRCRMIYYCEACRNSFEHLKRV